MKKKMIARFIAACLLVFGLSGCIWIEGHGHHHGRGGWGYRR